MEQIKIRTSLLQYLRGLVDSRNAADAKIFVGLVSLFYVIVASFVDLFTPLTPSEFIFFGVIGLVVAVFGLSTYTTQRAMTTKENVATSLIEENPSQQTADSAKQVLENERP